MRRGAVAGMLVAIVAAGVVARPPAAWACTCTESTTRQHFDRALAVFTGTVSAMAVTEDHSTVEFAVDAVYKGDVGPAATIGLDSGTRLVNQCTPQFVERKRYAVFATGEADALTTSIEPCSGTAEDAGRLGRDGFRPLKTYVAGTAEPVGAPSRAGAIASAMLLLLIVGGGWYLVWRRRAGIRPEAPG